MYIQVKVPGSCGELVQGTLRGIPFLVTCPINLYTKVEISDEYQGIYGLGCKAQLAMERVLDYLGIHGFPYGIKLKSQLPCGKGMASSSADIAAVCLGIAFSMKKHLSPEEVARIAAGIEPTDGVFFKGIVRINHMTGECQEHLGNFPRLHIAVFDTGGVVDTLEFHAKNDLHSLSSVNEEEIIAAIRLLRPPYLPEKIAEAATRSALANQCILPKTELEELAAFVLERGALGVNAAHSGTILGVLFSPGTCSGLVAVQVREICTAYPHLQYLQTLELISGGYSIEKG